MYSKQEYVKEHIFSIIWDLGCRGLYCEEIEPYQSNDIEEILNELLQGNSDILQIGVMYKFDNEKVVHTMELSEIAEINKDLIENIKNNQEARYFDSYCSCDFEFASIPVDDEKIRFIITDCNNEPIVLFDNIISKDNFLTEITRIFYEINNKIKEIVSDYIKRNNLSPKQGEELLNLLYEWR